MAPSKRELDQAFRMRIVQAVQQTLKYFFIFGCFAVVTWGLYGSVRVLAGKNTTADLMLRAYADLKANKPISLIVTSFYGLMATIWGAGERTLRKRYIKRMHPYQVERELEKNPKRSTSRLNPNGTTREEDV